MATTKKQKGLNVLLFSPSARKVWVQPITKILNPSYWLVAYLAARIGDEHNVYTIKQSFDPVGSVKLYNGQKIDVIVSIGASYNPATLKAEFNKGFPMHQRAFDIAEIVKPLITAGTMHINLCVDVRKWFEKLTEVFGGAPDAYITEQEMHWQQVGYTMNNDLFIKTTIPKEDCFFFSGGIKARQQQFLHLTKNIKLPKLIHGGGWNKYLSPVDGYICEGFNDYAVSVQHMLRAKYGLVIHEPEGNREGWITAKLFEHLGSRTIAFIDCNYDASERYIPKDHILRVADANDIQTKIDTIGYHALLAEQNKLINPAWSNINEFYVIPFLTKFNEVCQALKK